jgi:hypothetical protein
MRSLALAVAVFCCTVVHATDTADAPLWALKFDKYKVATIYRGKPATAKIVTRGQRFFRTRIREGAKRGPNFAGSFTIATWGCGSGCVSFAVVDARTGTVYDNTPFAILGLPFMGTESGRDYQGLDSKLRSRLLVADGCPEDDSNQCGTHYYEWTGRRFKQLRFEAQPQKRASE